MIMEACIVIFLLLSVQAIIFLLVDDETNEISFITALNNQEARTTRTRQHTLDFIQYPNAGTETIVQNDLVQWDQAQTYLLQNASRFGMRVSDAVYKTPAQAQGFRFYTNRILNVDKPSDYNADYASQTLYVGQYNTTLIDAENGAVDQATSINWTGFIVRLAITIVVALVMVIDLLYFLFFLYKPLIAAIERTPTHEETLSRS